MNKKLLIFTLLFILLFASFVSARQCDTQDILHVLRKALFDYYNNPAGSDFTPEDLISLLSFYVGIGSNEITVDCTAQSDNIDRASALPDNIPSCSDGTEYGKCSSTKPMYCYAGNLVPRCRLCGCPGGESCDVTYVYSEENNEGQWGKCYAGTDVTCAVDSDCGVSDYFGGYYCQNGDVYGGYNKDTCLNPGEVSSSCSNETIEVLVDDCMAGEECVDGACIDETIFSPNSMRSNAIFSTSILNYNYPIENAYIYITKGMEKNYAYGARLSQLSLSTGSVSGGVGNYLFASDSHKDWYYNKYGAGAEPNHLSVVISDLLVNQSMNKTLNIGIATDEGAKTVYFPEIPMCPGNNHWRVFYISVDGSTYYATNNHQCGYADLSPEEAIVPQHLARAAP